MSRKVSGQWMALIVVFVASMTAWGHDGHRQNPAATEQDRRYLRPIIIYPDKSIDSHRHDTTDRIQVISREQIDKSSATSLNEIVDNQPGVDAQDYCVNCGAKRLTINGLRAEHTSILVDGIPLYSPISSVYGLDAIPALAIEEIEVMRGSGSALINPDAIGGAINIFTVHPQESGGRIRLSLSDYQTQNYEALAHIVRGDIRWSVGGEFNQLRAWDVDRNGLSESPFRRRHSVFAKQTWNINENLRWSLRFGQTEMDIIGGNTQQFRPSTPNPVQAEEFDFEGGDVQKAYLGTPEKITDYLQIRRTEATSKLLYILNEANTLELNLGASQYRQDSLYMHGFDYDNRNAVTYGDVRFNHQINTDHSVLLGISNRRETLRSESQVMYVTNGVPKDDLNYTSTAGFMQHEWIMNHGLELSSALRVDRLDTEWIYLRDLQKTVVAPRFLLKWAPDDHFTNYLAYGRGYRTPLSFAESAHGTYTDGFTVNVRDIEKADSFMLSSSYNQPNYYITPSVHYTLLKNMAFNEEPLVAHSGPIEFISSNEDFDIYTYELLAGGRPHPNWLLEASFEYFKYEDLYKRRLPTAAIERRATIKSQVDWKSYSFFLTGVWVGSRDLKAYSNYEDFYNVNYGAFLGVDSPKRSRSPNFFTMNTSISKKMGAYEALLGIDNVFNYTQTRAGDSPAMWHSHSGHAHLDNRNVWGPNRGREVYLRLTYNF